MSRINTYSDQELIILGRRHAEANGGRLRQSEWAKDKSLPSRSTVCLRFGTWKKFCDKVGATPVPARAELKAAGRALAKQHGGKLRVADWDNAKPCGVGRGMVISTFGSWTAFVTECNLAGLANTRLVTDEQLVAWGVGLAEKLGKDTLTITDFDNAKGRPCTSQTIFNRFTSFSAYASAVHQSILAQQLTEKREAKRLRDREAARSKRSAVKSA